MKYVLFLICGLNITAQAASVKIADRERELERQVLSIGECTWRTTIAGKTSFSKVVLPVLERVTKEYYQVEITRESMFGDSSEKIVPDSRRLDSREELRERSFGLNGRAQCDLLVDYLKQTNPGLKERK